MRADREASELTSLGFRERLGSLCVEMGPAAARGHLLLSLVLRYSAECGVFDAARYSEALGWLKGRYGALAEFARSRLDGEPAGEEAGERELGALAEGCLLSCAALFREAGYPSLSRMLDGASEAVAIEPDGFMRALGIVAGFEPFDGKAASVLASLVVDDSTCAAGRAGGAQSTPGSVCGVVSRLARIWSESETRDVGSVYDPCFGLGSLALAVSSELGGAPVFGQELDPRQAEDARMRLILEGRPGEAEGIGCGDVLTTPLHGDARFDVVVSHAPSPCAWQGARSEALSADDRYSCAGVLAPSRNADLAFLMHGYSMVAEGGAAFCVAFPGALRRPGPEAEIRRYLVERNGVDAVIQLPARLFSDTPMSASIVVLRGGCPEGRPGILLIDLSREAGLLRAIAADSGAPPALREVLGRLEGPASSELVSDGASLAASGALDEVVGFLFRSRLSMPGGLSRVISREDAASMGYSLLPSDYAPAREGFPGVDKEGLGKRLTEMVDEMLGNPAIRSLGVNVRRARP